MNEVKSNVKALKPNSIFGVKLRATKLNGGWQPPQLIFSYVKSITVDAETQEPTVLVHDIFIPLQQREDVNQVTNTGIGPRIGMPAIFGKSDPEKQGPLFKRATAWDDVHKSYTDIPAQPNFTRIVDGSRIEATFDTADRVETKMTAVFDTVKSEISTRIAQLRDATADGGWRASKPWASQYKRMGEVNGVPVECRVLHQTVKLLNNNTILLDRAPRDIEPAAPVVEIGEVY